MGAELQSIAQRVCGAYEAARDNEYRRAALMELAGQYEIGHPEILLGVTDSALRRLPIRDRCERLGIVEEEWARVALSAGFTKFMADYEKMGYSLLRLAAQDKLMGAIGQQRRDADEVEDFSIEKALVMASPAAPTGGQVNVQINNGSLFDRAREELIETTTVE